MRPSALQSNGDVRLSRASLARIFACAKEASLQGKLDSATFPAA
jgi:hypothetical protein